MTRRRPPPPKRPRRPPGGVGAPPLSTLDEFSRQSVTTWLRAAERLRSVHSALHFGLEEQRERIAAELRAALQRGASGPFAVNDWARIVDYRYSLRPLSVRGSLAGDGGRFNIGADLNPASFTSFPALYVGEDYATAFAEKFGNPPTRSSDGLSPTELALRSPVSFTHVRLRGQIEFVLDVADDSHIKEFVRSIRVFHVPLGALRHARSMGASAPALIRSITQLREQLIDPLWRRVPMEFDLPSNSQVFGRLAAAAGLHGILYPSARVPERRCLALFPQNWPDSTSVIEVCDGAPEGAQLTRIDGTTALLE